MKVVEKLGAFYIGKDVSRAKTGQTEDLPLYFNAANLTTHAVCIGMTGSGKTGLGIAMLEEAGLDKIPALIIDPKGDLGNLLLTFPNLSADEFLPWIDKQEAERKEMTPEEYAKVVAKTWQDGLSNWGEGTERIQALRKNTEMVIYTPASQSGIPLSILGSFTAPSKEIIEDPEALRDRILSTTSSLLGLLGIKADPIKSREHILISHLISNAWNEGKDLEISSLIQQVQRPPFDKIGALDIDIFFSPKERLDLSITLNNLLASPGFQAWMEGEPLDIQNLLYTKEGKPKLAILSIAHLSDSERMFFVTILLNELVSWMRRQPGTSSLRALLYMDEIFGFFPPVAMPPSKIPMLTLLKQARAFGIGVILSTQNPVDLDYKGLSNCGTWFIGKLQTERDIARVSEGLQAASNGEMDSTTLNKMLASTGSRFFIMRSIHEKAPLLFETRWTMSYLRGPLTLSQISKLTKKSPASSPSIKNSEIKQPAYGVREKPIIPAEIIEFFGPSQNSQETLYKPMILGIAKLHYVDAKNKIDTWQEISLLAPPDEEGANIIWEEGDLIPNLKKQLVKTAMPESSFVKLPAGLMKEKNYAGFQKAFMANLYQNQEITIYQAPDLDLTSQLEETEEEFRNRISHAIQEKRKECISKLQNKYESKITALQDKLKRSQDQLNEKQQHAFFQKINTFISFITSLIGAFLGRGFTKGTVSQAGTTLRRAGRITQENQKLGRAEENFKSLEQQLEDQQQQMNQEMKELSAQFDADKIKINSFSIHPRKSDISVEQIALVWWPKV